MIRCPVEYRIDAGDRTRSGRGFPAAVAVMIMAIGLISARQARAATITVDTLDDSGGGGQCSLRDAITVANGTGVPGSGCGSPSADPSNEIDFSVAGTIVLTSPLPEITGHLSINPKLDAARVVLDGRDHYRIMTVGPSAIASIHNFHITHATLANDLASRHRGAGIDNAGSLTVRSSAFSHNSSATLGFVGASIGNRIGATLTVISSAFVENRTVVASTGGIFNAGNLTVTNCGFTRNDGSNGSAGAIHNERGATATVTDTTFLANAGRAGGGAIINRGDLTIATSTFLRNTTAAGAGGILNEGTLTVTNCTFAANATQRVREQADSAGAIENDGTLMVTNSTFSGNASDTVRDHGAGAIFNNGVARIKGTILAAPRLSLNCAGSITDIGYNISDDNSCVLSAIGSKNNTDPKLVAEPALNSGRTQTIALQPDSPAVDAIPFGSCTDQATPSNRLTADQRGQPRPDPEDGPAGSCDIGAYELAETETAGCTHRGRVRRPCGRPTTDWLMKVY